MEVNKMNPMHLFPKIPGKAVVVFSVLDNLSVLGTASL